MRKTVVVILNWNGIRLLQEFLPRVVTNTPDADIVIADNASTDDSVTWVRSNYPDLRIIRFDKNHGFARGYNLAIQELQEYENVILLNSDAAPGPDWIAPLETMLDKPDVVAVQPKLLSSTHPEKFEYAGAAGGFLDRHGYPYCRGRIFDTVEEDKGQYDTVEDIFWATGAALAVKRKAYLESGGLDSSFFAHMEEIDLCWRLQLKGGRIMYQPLSVVYHLGGGSLSQLSAQKTYLNFRNNLLMLHKNLPRGNRKKRLLFWRRLLDTIAWAKFLVSGQVSHAAAILRAHRDYRKMRHSYSTFPTQDLLAQKCDVNILVQYYLKGHRTWDSLPR